MIKESDNCVFSKSDLRAISTQKLVSSFRRLSVGNPLINVFFFRFDPFKRLEQKSKNIFVQFLEDTRTRKMAFEIYWPLLKRQWGSHETLTVHIFLLTQTQQPITKLFIQNFQKFLNQSDYFQQTVRQFGCLALELVVYSRKSQTQFKCKKKYYLFKVKSFLVFDFGKKWNEEKGIEPHERWRLENQVCSVKLT